MAGQLLGWYQSMFSLALILGPLLGGLLFQAVAPQAIFAVSAGLMVLTLFLSVSMQRLPQTAFPQNTPEERERVPMHH
jgi:MFS family permease